MSVLNTNGKQYEMYCKHFDELSAREIYEILRARFEVFVVEQKCLYQDIDGIDLYSYHVVVTRSDKSVAACLRLFRDERSEVRIGRVVTTERSCGLGRVILHEAVIKARELFDAKEITLHSQVYAIGFYQKEGFQVVSDEYIEDDIPHVTMKLELK